MSSGGESGGGVVESARQKFRNRSAGLLTRKTSRERVRAATAATAPPTSSSTAPDATLSDGASGSVPEITTSSAPDDDDARQPTSSTASPTSSELLKDEKYVERLARNLSRKLEKTRNKLQKRTSELSLIKASPDSRNPSVILSCASDDEDESHEKKTPVRDTLSAEQPAGQGRLFRGLRRKLSKTSKRDSSLKKEAVGKLKDESKKEANQDSGNVTIPGSGEDEDAISAASSSPSPPGSDYGGMVSHRGSWSTLLHAIGTAEMVQKVQRNAAEMKQERDIESLKRELEVHVSGNYQIKFGPVLPIWQAVLVFVLNVCLPGFGTVLSGMFLLSGRSFRTAEAKAKYQVAEHFGIVCVIGLSQMMTITFLLIGWIWAIVWGSWLIQLSMEHRKLVVGQRLIETHEQAGRLSIQVTRPPNEPGAPAGTEHDQPAAPPRTEIIH